MCILKKHYLMHVRASEQKLYFIKFQYIFNRQVHTLRSFYVIRLALLINQTNSKITHTRETSGNFRCSELKSCWRWRRQKKWWPLQLLAPTMTPSAFVFVQLATKQKFTIATLTLLSPGNYHGSKLCWGQLYLWSR